MKKENELKLPHELLHSYFLDIGFQQCVEQILDTRKKGSAVNFGEAASMCEAALSAEYLRHLYCSQLFSFWEVIWGSALKQSKTAWVISDNLEHYEKELDPINIWENGCVYAALENINYFPRSGGSFLLYIYLLENKPAISIYSYEQKLMSEPAFDRALGKGGFRKANHKIFGEGLFPMPTDKLKFVEKSEKVDAANPPIYHVDASSGKLGLNKKALNQLIEPAAEFIASLPDKADRKT